METLKTTVRRGLLWNSLCTSGKSAALSDRKPHVGHSLKAIERRIDTARLDQLDAWLDRVFDADSLEAVVGPAHLQH